MRRHTRKSDPTPVDSRRDDLFEGAELLGDRRLEVELKLDLGNDRAHLLPVLSGSNMGVPGKLTVLAHIRSQLRAGDLSGSHVSEARPILGLDQGLLAEPFGYRLLRDRWSIQELSKAFGERGLATGDLNRPFERGNVRFIHKHPKYTTKVVHVNNPSRSKAHNPGCIVLYMPVAKRRAPPSAAAATPRIKTIPRDASGYTLGDRMEVARRAKGMSQGHDYTQKDLLADASRIAGRGPNDKPIMTQQALSKIFKNKSFETAHIAALALALSVPPLWLAYGIGPSSLVDELLRKTSAA
jgi:hypothetical protein